MTERATGVRLAQARLAAIVVLAAVGVASKGYSGPGARIVVGQLWDACGSALLVILARLAFPRARPLGVALVLGGALVANELLQLVRTEWLDRLRATPLGGVVLGSGFSPRDLLAITAAVALAATADAWAARRLTAR